MNIAIVVMYDPDADLRWEKMGSEAGQSLCTVGKKEGRDEVGCCSHRCSIALRKCL